MFLNRNKRILSNALLMSALISLLCGGLNLLLRFLLRNFMSFSPDMLDHRIWIATGFVSVIQICLTLGIFIYYRLKLRYYITLIPEEERHEIGILQEEYLGKGISTLRAEDVKRLLDIWAVILVGAEIVYRISSQIYRMIIAKISAAMRFDPIGFSSVYSISHSFKYLGMMIAIILGVAITSIFLNDKYLNIACLVLSVSFLLISAAVEMQTISFLGRSIGIIWSSVFFHTVDIAGLLALAFYLRKRYVGV